MTDKTITVTLRMDLDDLAAQLRAPADALTSDRYAANEARQRAEASLSVTPSTDATVSDSEPDPLDENDHRDRVLPGGRRLVRNGPGHWHTATVGEGAWCSSPACRLSLFDWHRDSGPITFAPDASPAPQDAAQGAAEGERDAVEGGGPAGPVQEPDPEPVVLPEGWRLGNGHDLIQPGDVEGARVGVVARDHRKWYAMSAMSNEWRVCETKQRAVDFLRAEAEREPRR